MHNSIAVTGALEKQIIPVTKACRVFPVLFVLVLDSFRLIRTFQLSIVLYLCGSAVFSLTALRGASVFSLTVLFPGIFPVSIFSIASKIMLSYYPALHFVFCLLAQSGHVVENVQVYGFIG